MKQVNFVETVVVKNSNIASYLSAGSSFRYRWDPCPLNTTRSGRILHEGLVVRDRTKTINQKRTRMVLWSTFLRKPLKLISSHSIFFDLTCSQVTSNQGHPTCVRVRVVYARTAAADPPSRARTGIRRHPRDSISVILFVQYSSLRFADPWLTGYPWHLRAG